MKRKRLLVSLSTLLAILTTSGILVSCGNNGDNKNGTASSNIDNLNETGFPVVKEKINLRAVASTSQLNADFNEMKLLTSIDEKTGVDVKYECISSNVWSEKKNLMLASNDLPDFFIGGGLSDADIVKYGGQGLFVPLEDLIDKYAPNIKKLLEEKPNLRKALTFPDGHIYTLPYYDEYTTDAVNDNLFINKTWLDKLGLSIPTTTEEFYEVLKAFKTKDPNGNGKADEIPLSYLNDGGAFGEGSMFGSFGVLDNGDRIMIENGKIVFTPALDQYKDAIKWFRQLYTEGVIDKEIFTQDYSKYVGKGKGDELILGAFIKYFPENMVGEKAAKENYICIPPLKGPKGDQLWGRETGIGYYLNHFVMTSKNEHPEATMRWIDQWFEEEISMQMHWGELGKNLEKNGEKYSMLTPPDGMSADQYRYITAPAARAPGYMKEEMYDSMELSIDRQLKKERTDMYLKYATKEPMPFIRFTQEQLDELAVIKTDLMNYVKEMKAKWISGERDIDKDWNEFQATLKKMQVDRYLEIYQDGYDKFK